MYAPVSPDWYCPQLTAALIMSDTERRALVLALNSSHDTCFSAAFTCTQEPNVALSRLLRLNTMGSVELLVTPRWPRSTCQSAQFRAIVVSWSKKAGEFIQRMYGDYYMQAHLSGELCVIGRITPRGILVLDYAKFCVTVPRKSSRGHA